MRIVLPWPNKLLWPNGRPANHFVLRREQTKAKHCASWATIEARQRQGLPEFGEGEIKVTLYIHAKPKGVLPDKDNCAAAIKAYLDGIAKEIGVNDRRFSAPVVVFCTPRDGHIEVELSGVVDKKEAPLQWPESGDSCMQKIGPSGAPTPPSRDPINCLKDRSDAA